MHVFGFLDDCRIHPEYAIWRNLLPIAVKGYFLTVTENWKAILCPQSHYNVMFMDRILIDEHGCLRGAAMRDSLALNRSRPLDDGYQGGDRLSCAA
jgi:hypothetical protein